MDKPAGALLDLPPKELDRSELCAVPSKPVPVQGRALVEMRFSSIAYLQRAPRHIDRKFKINRNWLFALRPG